MRIFNTIIENRNAYSKYAIELSSQMANGREREREKMFFAKQLKPVEYMP